jgi:hypothetical protein
MKFIVRTSSILIKFGMNYLNDCASKAMTRMSILAFVKNSSQMIGNRLKKVSKKLWKILFWVIMQV